MRISILLFPLLLLLLAALAQAEPGSKIVDKETSYPKKVMSLKKRLTKTTAASVTTTTTTTKAPTGTPTTIKTKVLKPSNSTLERFKNLPEDDLEFIAELDKQFKVHGEKVKIKVERENTTDSKNSKRTIDGELGYGYPHNGYEYAKPKFMFYPYSQQDIPSSAPGYFPSVKIQPSLSYELKPQTFEIPQHTEPQIDLPTADQHQPQHQPQQQLTAPVATSPEGTAPHYDEPVIVLRIPGPAKYATHLQALLQQYLEIRAAQYLRILEQQSEQQQQQTLQQAHDEQSQYVDSAQQHYEQPAPQHYEEQGQQYAAPAPQTQYGHPTQDYQQEVSYAHQVAPTPASVTYPAIDDVYQSYKSRQQQQQQPEQQQYYQQEHFHASPQVSAEQPQQQQYYYDPQQYSHASVSSSGPAPHAYQNVYLLAMSGPDGQSHYAEQSQHVQQPIYVPDEQEHQQQHETLPISENSPRNTHTKVHFNSDQNAHDEYSTMYDLPSIRPYERHAPTPMPTYKDYIKQQQQLEEAQAHEQHSEQHGEQQQQHLEQQEYQHSESGAQQHEVSITQRPFNYHAHSQRGRTRVHEKRGVQTAAEADRHVDEIRTYVANKLGAKMGVVSEFRTTQIVEA